MTSNVIFIDWRVEDPHLIVAALPADIRSKQAAENIAQGRFARAIRTNHPNNFSHPYCKSDLREYWLITKRL